MSQSPPNLNGLGTLEFYTEEGDTTDDVKIRLISDTSPNINKAISEHIANIQFGVFFDFIDDEQGLAERGRIFRAGIKFAQRRMMPPMPPDDRGPRPVPDKPQYLQDLERILKRPPNSDNERRPDNPEPESEPD